MQAKVEKEMGAVQEDPSSSATQAEKEEVDARSVYVGNVDYACTPEEVQQHFQSCGTVNRVTILTDKFGQPKGFAYMEFVEQEAIPNALLLNESELHGRGRQLKQEHKRCKYCIGIGTGYLVCARCSGSGSVVLIEPVSTFNGGVISFCCLPRLQDVPTVQALERSCALLVSVLEWQWQASMILELTHSISPVLMAHIYLLLTDNNVKSGRAMLESACRAELYTSSSTYLMFHSPHNCSKSNLHTVIPQQLASSLILFALVTVSRFSPAPKYIPGINCNAPGAALLRPQRRTSSLGPECLHLAMVLLCAVTWSSQGPSWCPFG
ncbi:hypothetical protein QQ045_020362 [Rhodiola kirilowii]